MSSEADAACHASREGGGGGGSSHSSSRRPRRRPAASATTAAAAAAAAASPPPPAAAAAAAASASAPIDDEEQLLQQPTIDFAAGQRAISSAATDASALHALATRWFHAELIVTTRTALLQIMALLQQYTLTHRPPSSKKQLGGRQATKFVQSFEEQVRVFYDDELKHQWRHLLAARLMWLHLHKHQLMDELLTTMAKVHVTVLQETMQKIWIKQQPLLLITALDEVSRRAMQTREVRAMLTCITVEMKHEFKQTPPTSREAAAALVQSWIDAAALPSLSQSRDGTAAASASTTPPSRKRRRRRRHSTATPATVDQSSREEAKEEASEAPSPTLERKVEEGEEEEEDDDDEEEGDAKRRKPNVSASEEAEDEEDAASSPHASPPPKPRDESEEGAVPMDLSPSENVSESVPLSTENTPPPPSAAVLPPALSPITTAEEKQEKGEEEGEEEEEEAEEEEEVAPARRGRRVFADQQVAKEPPAYAASLRQRLEEDARVAAKEVAKKTRRIDELVANLQVAHEDHMQRVQSAASGPDLTGDLLQQISTLQASLPSNESGEDDELPFFHVPQALVDQWALDIEELEVALGSPFHPSSSPPQPLDDTAAQQVCTILTGWLRLLESESESSEMPFVHKLLLAKKLMCVDQLRPLVEEEENPPYQLLELRALLLRLSATDSMWSFALRLLPVSFFAKSQKKMQKQSAAFYVKAAAAAAAAAPSDVLQRVRLLVEQCRVLDSGGQLHKAKKLMSVELDYPQAPIDVLYALHKQYPAAGPAFDFSLLEQFDEEASAWQRETAEMNRNATALEQAALLARKEGEEEGDPAAAAEAAAREARAAVTERERHPPRGGFIQCMQKSRLFFHTDKRLHDTSASDEDKAAQFARCNEAWDQLSACRSRFQELRQFRTRMASQ